MKRLFACLFLLLSLGALAQQFPGLSVDAFGFKQEGETVTVMGKVKNDGTFIAKKVVIEAVGLIGDGDGAEQVATQEFEVGDVGGGEFHKFDFKFPCKEKLTSVLMRIKSAKFR